MDRVGNAAHRGTKIGKLAKPLLLSEARVIHLAGEPVGYTLKRSARRRTVGLRIDETGLTVSAPPRVSQRWLESLLLEKSVWVLGKLAEMRGRAGQRRVWRDGENLLFLGEELRLALCSGNSGVQRSGGELQVALAEPSDAAEVQARVVRWYRSQALPCFHGRTAIFCSRLGAVALPVVRLSNARTRWGSCSPRGHIRLNWRLIQAPLDQIDYVVAHELAHLKHMNHSPAFWQAVAEIYPEYAAARAALGACAAQYHSF